MKSQNTGDRSGNRICGVRNDNAIPISNSEENSPNRDTNCNSTDGAHRRCLKSNGENDKRQSKHSFFCLSLWNRLRRRYAKNELAYQNNYDQENYMTAYTDGFDMSESAVDKIGSGPIRTSSEEDSYHLKNDDEKGTKESISSDAQIPTMTDITKTVSCNEFGDVPASKSVTSDALTSPNPNTILVKDVEIPVRLENGLLSCERKNSPTGLVDELEQVDNNLTSKERGCLKIALEHCERRLERLYGRLIWLRNSECTMHSAQIPQSESKSTLVLSSEAKDQLSKKEGNESAGEVQNQLKTISSKMHDLKCQIEAFSFLSWIGLLQEPHTNQMSIPGLRAPPANPKLYLTRRPDSEARETAREYKRICEHLISDPVRMDLRRVTFNNWPWNPSWLLRFLRQMFIDLGFIEEFSLPLKRLDVWLCDIYRRYNRVPFHNFKHAFMVTQMCYALLWGAKLTESLAKEDQLTLIVSAICHDLDHPGFNNAYQINAGTELAMRYNDQSPLENHHCATAFDIMSHSEANPFEHLDPNTKRRIRDGIIRCILATDMSRHNEIVNQFTSVVLNDLDIAWEIDEETGLPFWAVDKAKRDLVMMILIKVCDISNEARPLTVAAQWIDRLLAEFFYQSDYEKLVGLPVAPFMDRDKVTKAASQCGFIRFVILPLFESLAKLLPPVKTLLVQPALEQLSYYTEMQNIDEQQKPQENKKDHESSSPQ